MSSAAEILVVILSIALAIFIILGIVLSILLIRVTKQIGEFTQNANSISSNVDRLVQNVVNITSPVIIGKAVLDFFNKNKKKKG